MKEIILKNIDPALTEVAGKILDGLRIDADEALVLYRKAELSLPGGAGH